MATTIITKRGNSIGVRIPKLMLENLGMSEGDIVDITADHDMIVIKKTGLRRRSAKEIYGEYEGEYDKAEFVCDWGEPSGKEVW
ncbi:MAG: AbrB/MazE/SpoVT family DNA-binding domain-containing protein [Clostridiales bacterium]|jgi:antitoxin MazE|nr:AbrB/MazE/SpoVT family DNA-binding domain-containing protein [Clostridiales bacterium]